MTIEAKICGINSAEAMKAAVAGGADLVGLVFYPPSPRAVTPAQAAQLAAMVPHGITRVGLFVGPGDDLLRTVLDEVALDLIQLHGAETPQRASEIRSRFGRPVMKAIKVAAAGDLSAAEPYLPVVERLMFDAKPPKHMKDALPGGNGGNGGNGGGNGNGSSGNGAGGNGASGAGGGEGAEATAPAPSTATAVTPKNRVQALDKSAPAATDVERPAFENQTDAPPCPDCGSIMVRNAACYKCLNCGSTSGCS